mmetsp:Transcript_85/g.115  ORF Transcript_85/g.115 Transcript_85/m.115 type:complete len:133 (-) Transcript_85:156-554(-)
MKLIRQYQTGKAQLYNLTSDLEEAYDISMHYPNLVDEMANKLRHFGPCYDRKIRFDVTHKSIDKSIRKGCSWFARKNTKKRCKNYPAAQDYCRFSCALVNSIYCKIPQNTIPIDLDQTSNESSDQLSEEPSL